MSYEEFNLIHSEASIATFFNHIMRKLYGVRMVCAPTSFRKDKNIAKFQDSKFCDLCRYETWMHAVVTRLEGWRDILDEYFTEYEGRWKYYAASHRISDIKEYGGEKNDYNDDGSIRTDRLKDKEYIHYTVLSDLYDDGFKDIVQDTLPSDIEMLCADLIANSRIDIIRGLKECFGGKVQAFKEYSNGELRPLSSSEHELEMVAGQVDAEDDSVRLMAIISGIHCILQFFQSCKYNDDNTEVLKTVYSAVGNILNMDFKKLKKNIKRLDELKA